MLKFISVIVVIGCVVVVICVEIRGCILCNSLNFRIWVVICVGLISVFVVIVIVVFVFVV